MRVDAGRPAGSLPADLDLVGYYEPNYATLPESRALLAGLAALHGGPVHIRVHDLLTSRALAPKS